MSFDCPAKTGSFGQYLLGHLQRAFQDIGGLSPQVQMRLPHIVSRVLMSHQRREEVFQERGVSVPTVLFLAVTGECNLHCAHCYTQVYARRPMEGWLARRIVGEAYALGVSLIVVTGGEPLLHPDFFDIPREFPDLPFLVFSNGTLVERFLENEAELANLIWAISLDGPREHTDARRGAGTFEAAAGALDALAERGLPFGFSTTLGAENLEAATDPEFIESLAGKGCRAGIFLEQIPHPVCDPPLSGQISERLGRLRAHAPIPVIGFPSDEMQYGGCQAAGHGMVHISPDGHLEPCPAARITAQSLVDVSLEAALSSPFMNGFRELKQRFADAPSACTHACSYAANKACFQSELAKFGAVAAG